MTIPKNIEIEIEALATTYYHRAVVLRPMPLSDAVFDDFELVEIYNNLQCAVSYNSMSAESLTDTTQPIEYVATLFARPDIKIITGDNITVDVHGWEYEFLAGEGVIYPSHIEVPLKRKDDA